MKKLIATLLAATMIFGVAGCSKKEEETEKTKKTKSEETDDTEDPDETKDTEDTKETEDTTKESGDVTESESEPETEATQGAAGGALSFTQTEKHTLRHEPYDITMEYEIPVLDGFTIKQTTTENYFGMFSEDGFTYKSDDGSRKNVEFYHVDLYTYNSDDLANAYTESDRYEHYTTDNGYTVSMSLKDDPNENKPDEGPRWEINAVVSGDVYRDANIISAFRLVAYQTDVTEQEFRDFCMSIFNSVKYTQFNQDALLRDGEKFELYTHNVNIPQRVELTPGGFDVDLATSQGYPIARVIFNDDDLSYEMTTEILSYNSMKWANCEKDPEKFVPCKIAGYDAFISVGVGSSVKFEFTIKFSDEHVEMVSLKAPAYADGSNRRDDVSFSDYRDQLMDDEHIEATKALFIGYVDQFVSTWEILDA